MSGRSYLSIGDVLSLLREEFPDVTISKIRFLESQGLVDPERSPSGYRKFYEHDVERLRWVLRQQREHFLPLKVIRDRLAAAGNGVPSDEPYEPVTVSGTAEPVASSGTYAADAGPSSSLGLRAPVGTVPAYDAEPGAGGGGLGGSVPDAGEPQRPDWLEPPVPDPGEVADEALVARARLEHVEGRGAGNGDAGSVRTVAWPSPGAGEPQGSGEPQGAGEWSGTGGQPVAASTRSAGPRHGAGTGRPSTAAAPGAREPAPQLPVADEAPGLPAPGDATGPGERAGLAATQPAWAPQATAAPDASGEMSAGPSPAAPAADTGPGDAGHAAAPSGGAAPGHAMAPAATAAPGDPGKPPGGSADVLSAAVSGASLTLDELCAATGLAPAGIASLESFGLIAPMAVAGATYYDEEALTVAKLVVEFGKYGIEPRHLRLYRNAVDREVGLLEQVVTPLLRQRNPEARQRAVESAAELVRLGQGLRSSLVRSELRRQLGS